MRLIDTLRRSIKNRRRNKEMKDIEKKFRRMVIMDKCHLSVHNHQYLSQRPVKRWVRMVSYDVFEEFNGKDCKDMNILKTLESWGCCHECYTGNDIVKGMRENESRPWNYWKYIVDPDKEFEYLSN